MWIIISLLAVIFQTTRNMLSKKLKNQLGSEAVNLSRFLPALPIMIIFYSISKNFGNVVINSKYFFIYIFFLAIAQALASYLSIILYKYKNFAVAVAFTKTETLFTAILAAYLLSEKLNPIAWVGIIISMVGLFLASLAKNKKINNSFKKTFLNKNIFLGLFSGLIFSIGAISAKGAMNLLTADHVILKAIFSLTIALIIQTIILIPISLFKNKQDLVNIFQKPILPIVIGFCSALGTVCWFFAFALIHTAYVKTVGQIEFILSIFVSLFIFKEKILKNEYIGMLLILLGCLLLIIF